MMQKNHVKAPTDFSERGDERITADEFRLMLNSLAADWSARRYEEAAARFSPDILYVDPIRYTIRGRDRLLDFFRNDEGYPQITTWRHIFFDEASQVGIAEYSYRGTHLYHGVVLAKMNRGQIEKWREFQHISEFDWETFFHGAAF